jgi:hypothetical protein
VGISGLAGNGVVHAVSSLEEHFIPIVRS